MPKNRFIGPILLVVLLIAFGLLTAILPGLRDTFFTNVGPSQPAASSVSAPAEEDQFSEVVIEPGGYLLGEELVKIPTLGDYDKLPEEERTFNSLIIMGIITAIVVGGLVALTIPIAAIMILGSRTVTTVQETEAYREGAASLEATKTAYVKDRKEAQPPDPVPDHERTTWSAWSTGMVAVMLAYFAGYVLGEGINPGLGGTLATVLSVITIVASFLLLRPRTIVEVEETSDKSPNWSLIWVLVSGGIMMGLGVGLMFVVISGGDPFPYIIWEPEFAINWAYFQDLIEPLTVWN